MNKEIRVMLCDDSAIMRRLIKTALDLEPSLKVVCEAKHGREAVDQLEETRPDIVVMDIEMPVMDGVEAVREIRKLNRSLPVIMFSSLTNRGAEASLDAIAAGATDFATKPTGAGHIQQALESLRRDLIPKLLQWTAGKRDDSGLAAPGADLAPTASYESLEAEDAKPNVAAVAIGVSTGGPQALSKLLSGLPEDFAAPILIVQHMPPVFTGLLAQRLSAQTGHDVREAVDGDRLTPGTVLIAPGDHHMLASREHDGVRVRLNQDPPENSCRPSVNPLFCSLAKCFGEHSLGIVLTGMGQDGTRGAKALKSCGGRVFVQDKETSIVWGMPGQVAQSGFADRVLPLDQIASHVVRVVGSGVRESMTVSSS
ncbi:Chemotaxis response regulator protein-glutamate methylesterase [Stieleria maiorica]|uniref:Protein-glutamate methylesterase/protein-glutamine glutaminase n=1 Tax=Stieleria maiorica TaxID=2795974 RepID=A0A5B9MP65_9BACT|nr:chemotaxis response regulator protein-glutamate methylesterase [Stieleria maiorica]QEG01737.1 Chemotaxis response regulator protein-glutamate methylesterase [Stieleria maiorica]